MYFIGLDVHERQSSYCMMNGNGQVVKQETIRGDRRQVVRALGELPGPMAIVYEASLGYGWLYEQLQKIARRVVVAHPGHLRLIFQAKRKNDRIDAKKLALLLYIDAIPAAHVPDAEQREWRRMIETRRSLVAKRTRCKNSLRAWLRRYALTPPCGLWTRAGLAWLRQQNTGRAQALIERDMLLEELALLDEQIARITRELDQRGREHSGVAVLRTAPGVGPRTAEAVAAYLGDPHRFARNKQVGAYLGLVPELDDSGPTHRLGHITRQGPASVRQMLVEAAWQAIRRSPTVRAYFERICGGKKDRRKIALVATAHYLARCMHAMLKTGEAWRETVEPDEAA